LENSLNHKLYLVLRYLLSLESWTHILMQDLTLSQWWKFKFMSSGLWHSVVLQYNTETSTSSEMMVSYLLQHYMSQPITPQHTDKFCNFSWTVEHTNEYTNNRASLLVRNINGRVSLTHYHFLTCCRKCTSLNKSHGLFIGHTSSAQVLVLNETTESPCMVNWKGWMGKWLWPTLRYCFSIWWTYILSQDSQYLGSDLKACTLAFTQPLLQNSVLCVMRWYNHTMQMETWFSMELHAIILNMYCLITFQKEMNLYAKVTKLCGEKIIS